MYISFESFSLCWCPGPTDLFFERRSWRTKSLDNGQIIGLGILKTWGAMEGWAPTSGKLCEANGKKLFKVFGCLVLECEKGSSLTREFGALKDVLTKNTYCL